jgi:molybdate-binding protein
MLTMVRLAHADSLYERIAAEILRRVASGELRPGDRLPPIRQAAGEWGVNLNTVARAYAALAERGILETRAGGGTVVARSRKTGSMDGLDPVSQARAERLQARVGSAVLEALAAGSGEAVLLVTLAHRQQGLIVAAGNPKRLTGIPDLGREDVTIVNRHRGSGTRVLLDEALVQAQIDPLTLRGYDREEATHLAVAGAVAAGTADAGLGIMAAARAYGLDFVPVARERYELALRPATAARPAVQGLLETLRSADFRAVVTALGGYDTAESGAVRSAG